MSMMKPGEIETRSFEIIDSEAQRKDTFSPAAWNVVRRIIHTGGDVALEEVVHAPDDDVMAGVEAIRKGAPIWTDSRMAAAGISEKKLAAAAEQYVTLKPSSLLELPNLHPIAQAKGWTMCATAVHQARERLPGSIIAIGNAPTALEMVLDLIAEGMAPPALIVGMPVGFVGAVESKERLVEESPCPCISVTGRRGGSNMAAATINALALLAAAPATANP